MYKLLDAKHRLVQRTKRFFTSKEEGASGVEYGLLVALIAAVIIAAVQTIGTKVSKGFSSVATTLP
jgi:pilus assembly protein Flp/PilA